MKCALLSLALLPLCAGYVKTSWTDLAANPHYSFADYVAEYGKTYGSNAEYAAAAAQFDKNLRKIRAHNALDKSWKMGLNHLSDIDPQDKTAMKRYTGKAAFNTGKLAGASPATASDLKGLKSRDTLPDSVNWRQKGATTPVKDQGACGSCWAFSSTESLESHLFLATGTLLELAPQQLVSCVGNPDHCGGRGGCQGATAELAFAYAAANGTVLNTNYPYTQQTGTCDAKKLTAKAAGFTGYKQLPANDNDALMQALANVGPVSISVDASGFHSYESGIFEGSDSCWDINHLVQAVGYGTDAEGNDFYLVRNSWSATWGEEGYVRMRRYAAGSTPCYTDLKPQDGSGCDGAGPEKVCGTCGMLSDSSYPTGGYLVDKF